MLPFPLAKPAGSPLKLLLLGAHCDDIEIGCGGTVLQLLAARPDTEVSWVVFSSNEIREREARASAALFLQGAGRTDVLIEKFRDGYFPWEGMRIKETFDRLRTRFDPDLVFTHHREDRHQDHRMVSDLTWNTWRSHLVLEYEVPKYDGDLGQPNLYNPLTRAACGEKARAICEVFRSESRKGWMTEDTFLALARLRGVECGAPEGYAEAFHCRKAVLGL